MSFNVGKCKVMHLGKHNLEWNYVMRQQRLKVVAEERDLGVVLRDDLKVSSNCQQAYIKASRMLGLMARTVRFRNLEVMTRLYKSLVRPHLEYCASAWSVKDMSRIGSCWREFSAGSVEWCRDCWLVYRLPFAIPPARAAVSGWQ